MSLSVIRRREKILLVDSSVLEGKKEGKKERRRDRKEEIESSV